jgi:hypothetical protein
MVDKAAQEKEWAKTFVNLVLAHIAQDSVSGAIVKGMDGMSEDELRQVGANLRERKMTYLVAIGKALVLLSNPAVTAERLKVGLSSLEAAGEDTLNMTDTIREYTSAKEKKKCIEDVNLYDRRIRVAVETWDKTVNEADSCPKAEDRKLKLKNALIALAMRPDTI